MDSTKQLASKAQSALAAREIERFGHDLAAPVTERKAFIIVPEFAQEVFDCFHPVKSAINALEGG
jgi:hypothetical protein